MFAIEVETTFTASHALRLPGGGEEPVHAHDFRVIVRVEARELDALETVMDFHELEQALAGVVGPWRGRKLNEVEPFRTRVNPSAERIAEQIGLGLREAGVVEVRITEAANCLAVWTAK